MPPKTKKQIRAEEKARLAEEKRLQEEEEKKRQQQEEAKRQEQERLRIQKEKKLEKEEKERIQGEQIQVQQWRESIRGKAHQQEKKLKEKLDWQKYTQSNLNKVQKPDVDQETQITQYLSQYQENLNKDKFEIQKLLNELQYAEEFAQELVNKQMKCIADKQYLVIQWCQNYIDQFRQISQQLINKITSYLAINSDILIEQKQQELIQKQIDNPNLKIGKDDNKRIEILKIFSDNMNIKYGIWINPNSKSGFRIKPVDFQSLQVQCEVPRPLMNIQLIMNAVWTSYDILSSNPNQKEYIIGGILDITCYEFLSLPKKTNEWQIKYNYKTQEALRQHYYPPLDNNGQVNQQNVFPVKIQYTLSKTIYIHPEDKPKIAFFDGQNWSQENIEDVKLDNDQKIINFTTMRLAPIAYIQDKTIDFPYRGFQIRCINNEKALIDIKTKRLQLKFEIGPSYSILLSQQELNLPHLMNKKMSPGTLLKELYQCGINILPQESDFELVNLQVKDQNVEDHAIEDLSLAVRSYFIRSSRQSHMIENDKILVKIKENMDFDDVLAEDQEKDWKSIVFWQDKVGCVQTKYSQDKINMQLKGQSLTHSTLQILLSKYNLTNQDAIDNLKREDFILFSECLRRFLKLTRVLSFTTDNK